MTLIFVQAAIGQEWKSITPLKSTKTDVEKILGKPVEKSESEFIYEIADGKIYVYYASRRCRGKLPGWNVDTDTVLGLSFVPNSKQPASSDEVTKISNESPIAIGTNRFDYFYINPEKGTVNLFYRNSDLLLVLTESQITPKVSDNHLRCKGFPPYNVASDYYSPDKTFKLTSKELKDFIEMSSLALPNHLKLYLVTYRGSDMSKKKYDSYLWRIRGYINSKKWANQKAVVMIDGGRTKEESKVELFPLNKDYPPPVPRPDF